MRIGITGGTGFLGDLLSRTLIARGDRVSVFTRSPERAAAQAPPGVHLEPWNPGVDPLPPSVLDELDAVIHLAGERVAGPWTEAKRRRIRESRVTGTRHVVQGFREAHHPPAVLLSGSAVGFYGSRGEEELTEDSPPGDGFLPEVCVAWETEARAVEALGTRSVLLRTGLPLSPASGFLHAILPLFKAGLGGPLGDGRQWLPWIHIEDWEALVLFALDHAAVRGALNLTAPTPVRNEDFTHALGRVLHRPTLFRAPAFALKLALFGRAAEETALTSQRVLPIKARGHEFVFRFPELTPALTDLLA